MSIRRRFRFRRRLPSVVSVPAPEPAEGRPRMLVAGQTGVEAIRTQLATDSAFRARWQTMATQLAASTSTFNTAPNDAYFLGYLSFLMAIRRSDDDLGITWGETWQDYVDHILNVATNVMAQNGQTAIIAAGQALIYDNLYNDMSDTQRATLSAAVDAGFTAQQYLGAGGEVYDNGGTEAHFAKVMCGMAGDGYLTREDELKLWTMRQVDTNDWMGYGYGLGREFHEGVMSRHGVPFLLKCLQNAYGLADSETIDHFLTHLRDNWQLVIAATIPHPSALTQPSKFCLNALFHTQDPTAIHHTKRNVSAAMLNAYAYLPGKISLDGTSMTDTGVLANSEADYFGYLRTRFDEGFGGTQRRRLLDFTKVQSRFVDGTFSAQFFTFPAYLIDNAQEYTAVNADTAGIPKVRRWWPGTLDWTFIRSSNTSYTSGSFIYYRHRKWGASQYEEGCRQNGSWVVHRDGPLLLQAGETGHSSTTRRATHRANGTVTFVDPNRYADFSPLQNSDEVDNAWQRPVLGDGKYQELIIANPNMDFGDVTSWYADSKVVAISSNLVRSYQSSEVRVGTPESENEAAISAFTREFVVVRNGGDGTTREKVFTFDRITLLDTKFEPRYNLNPSTTTEIDGTESEVLPWGPEQAEDHDWYATGSMRWDYAGATRMIARNNVEPVAPSLGTGKAVVSWLRPAPADARIRKSSGVNCVTELTSASELTRNGAPSLTQWYAWFGETFSNTASPGYFAADGSSSVQGWPRTTEERAYVGLYHVAVSPTNVAAWQNAGGHFLMATEVMHVNDTPNTPAELTCDAGSVGCHLGPSAVIFSKSASGHTSGSTTIPSGVTLLTLCNLTPGQTVTLTPGTGLSITTSGPYVASSGNSVPENALHGVAAVANTFGRLVVEVSGAGTLAWS